MSGIVWCIAFRNLREHRVKSVIVGTITLIGTFVLVVGNSLMDSAAAGVRRSFIDLHRSLGAGWRRGRAGEPVRRAEH